MTVQYFIRESDPTRTVYEVDFAAGTWRVFGADGDQPRASGWLIDGGEGFRSVYFARIDMTYDGDDTVTFRRISPRIFH